MEPLTAIDKRTMGEGNFGSIPEIIKAHYRENPKRFRKALFAMKHFLGHGMEDPATGFGDGYWRLMTSPLADAKQYIREYVQKFGDRDGIKEEGHTQEELIEAMCTLYEGFRHTSRLQGSKEALLGEYRPGVIDALDAYLYVPDQAKAA